MLICPNCLKQYASETSNCETCSIPLVKAEDFDLVELMSFANVSEAEMLKELLEQNGIRTILQGEVDPIGIASRAETAKLLVENKDLIQARELFQAYFSQEEPGNAQEN